ncbi:MAG: hypothetical protein A2758_00605 [Candidatus Zambryskibacteria bacterium RIFCSPHIGHO2_01_FULL_49_18]|uniref:Pectate lyase C n=2 Tax=Candidatus Zambryskiibacteriota TaxID=1817925 RepID=A0A1G2T2T4_9BACT|nr:MAG: hypothetical protein A2758_00605 [Candidatus Zambryskibacteria bacterium RIFCSPHIGHO2_01_FULL_49_18]OHB05924.1 MAG: hypothetical protein A3A26_03190 [Candidatus Zambryskibacteria bacterium RIFCSPLOWO2_01_FULL_47_14]
MSAKKVIVLILTLAIASSSFAPTVLAQTSVPVSDSALRQKEVGITIFGYTVPGLSWDSIALVVAKHVIDKIVNSTVKWINNGFEGNPAYVSNPKQYFADIADGVAGEFIRNNKDLNLLCSPFQANIRLSLMQEYYEPEPYQCTLTEVVGNTRGAIEDFYNDFSKGGWDAWFSMTQNPTNNPYGAYLKARVDLDSRIASAIGLKDRELNQGRGFLSYKKCTLGKNTGAVNSDEVQWNLPDDPNGCIGGLQETVTPGSVIENQLSNVLGTGVRQLELADEFDEIVGALVTQLIQKIFGSVGLSGAGKGNAGGTGQSGEARRAIPIDTDGDGIIDGTDTDGDGRPDICLFGGENGTVGPPCLGSRDQEEDGNVISFNEAPRATVVDTYRPPADGWWSDISPNGRYVVSGNSGSFVTNVKAKTVKDITIQGEGADCRNKGWFNNDTIVNWCYGKPEYQRIEMWLVEAGSWAGKLIAQMPVIGNDAVSFTNISRTDPNEGHWLTTTTEGLYEDGVFIGNGIGHATIDGNKLYGTCDGGSNLGPICIYENYKKVGQFTIRGAVGGLDALDGYVAWGGYGKGAWGRTPTGRIIALGTKGTVMDGVPKLFKVNNQIWAGHFNGFNSCLLRPWGEKSVIIVDDCPAASWDVEFDGTNIVISAGSDRGELVIHTISPDSPRSNVCGSACSDMSGIAPIYTPPSNINERMQ